MDSETFLGRCLAAMGGLSHLHGVRTIRIRSERTVFPSRETVQLTVFRKAGGRIRIEESLASGTTTVTIVNGLAGVRHTYDNPDDVGTKKWPLVSERLTGPEVETVKRSIRLYPRNFLAHADEHSYSDPIPDEVAGQSVFCVELPAENARFCFDGETFLCRSLLDRNRGLLTIYEDYRAISEVTTPCRERRFLNNRLQEEETVSEVLYNLEVADELFEVKIKD
ncbi:MAG: hypothetical protein K1Y36_06080 [Blastocatellia bacterium]|nr:hypothetical protein [Blastocatellia bacterium]